MTILVNCPCGSSLKAPDSLAGQAAKCPTCGAQLKVPQSGDEPVLELADAPRGPAQTAAASGVPSDVEGTRIAAGLFGILLGSFGVHKFILGMTGPGIIMLSVTLLTCGLGAIVTHTIGLIEGILYLTKSNAEFYETYIVNKRNWF